MKQARDFWAILRGRLHNVPRRWWLRLFAISFVLHIALVGVILLLLFGGERGGTVQGQRLVVQTDNTTAPHELELPDKIADTPQITPDEIDLAEILELPLETNLNFVRLEASTHAALAPRLPHARQSLVQQSQQVMSGGGLISGVPQSFADYITHLQQTGMDVVFVIDATGSMVWVHQLVRDRIDILAAYIRSLVPLARFGLIVYRDYHDPEFVTRQVQPSFDIQKIKTFMGKIDAVGGGDVPEAVTAALRLTETATHWRAGAQRVVILVGDAPPHSREIAEANAIAARFNQIGGRLSALDSRVEANRAILGRLGGLQDDLSRQSVLASFRHLARQGGGAAVTLSDERRLMKTLALLIFDDRYHDELAPFLANLE